MSKFSTLISIRRCFDSVTISNEKRVVSKLVEHLLDSNHGSTILRGIFRQLYWEGEDNSEQFLNDLLSCCQKITSKDNTEKKIKKIGINCAFDQLPDSLMCHVGSFLTTREIFSKWDLVNRRFLQMGLKPEILTQWNFSNYDKNYYKINSSKFDISPLLQQIESFSLDEHTEDLAEKIGIKQLKSLRMIEYTVDGCFMSTTCGMLSTPQFDTLCIRDVFIDERIKGSERLKRIDLIDCQISHEDMDEHDVDNFLQIVVPLSPKEIELRQQLKQEVTDEMRKSIPLSQIEKLEKDIEDKINKKYDPKFDENELNQVENNSRKNLEYEWNSQLEMLSLVNLDAYDADLEDSHRDQLRLYCVSQLTPNRIQNTLTNLRGLCLYGMVDWDSILIGPLSVALLNILANQLTSLHLDHTLFSFLDDHWTFIRNNYPCTKESLTQSWHPANVQELCLSSKFGYVDQFWKRVSSTMFPHLKHLKIVDGIFDRPHTMVFGSNAIHNAMTLNLSSLIVNGLESLQLKFIGMDCRDFDPNCNIATFSKRKNRVLIKDILQSIRSVFSQSKNDQFKQQQSMIVKLEFEINIPDMRNMVNLSLNINNEFENLSMELLSIYSWLAKQYDRFMLGFKLNFLAHRRDDTWVYRRTLCSIRNDIKRSIKNHIIFENEHGRVVETSITSEQDCIDKSIYDKRRVAVAAMFKSWNKSETNMSCEFCHTEPKFKYHCHNCQAESWGLSEPC